jgi:hypothetical protein
MRGDFDLSQFDQLKTEPSSSNTISLEGVPTLVQIDAMILAYLWACLFSAGCLGCGVVRHHAALLHTMSHIVVIFTIEKSHDCTHRR